MSLRTLNIDLDGCVYPWHELVASWFGLESADSFPTWEVHNTLRMTEEEFALWHQEVVRNRDWFNRAHEPIRGAKETLTRLSDEGFNIRIITNRLLKNVPHSKPITQTVDWLDRMEIPYWDITFLGKNARKGDFVADYALDDKPGNVLEMSLAGTDAWLFRRPWNGDGDSMGINQLSTWSAFEAIVMESKDQLSLI